MVDWSGQEEYKKDARSYFLCCPICGYDQISLNFIAGGRDTLSCDSCGAKWHLYVGLSGFKWAELELCARDGKGRELFGKRFNKEECKIMAQNARKALSFQYSVQAQHEKQAVVTKEKEIIRQKEVIIKIRCSYCKGLFNETLDKCPHCGAKV